MSVSPRSSASARELPAEQALRTDGPACRLTQRFPENTDEIR
jgi:hypothetical protein